jgi:hypothetical protein
MRSVTQCCRVAIRGASPAWTSMLQNLGQPPISVWRARRSSLRAKVPLPGKVISYAELGRKKYCHSHDNCCNSVAILHSQALLKHNTAGQRLVQRCTIVVRCVQSAIAPKGLNILELGVVEAISPSCLNNPYFYETIPAPAVVINPPPPQQPQMPQSFNCTTMSMGGGMSTTNCN